MADRTVVRKGPVVSLALTGLFLAASLGLGPDGAGSATAPKDKDKVVASTAKPAAVAPENQPYKIKAWLSLDPRARVDPRGRELLIAGWKTMVKRFVGPPWELEIDPGDGPLSTNALENVTPEMVIPQAKGFDKAWLIRVEPSADGLSFAAREFDSATAQIGLLCRRNATVLADGPRALLQVSLDVFAASATIGESADGGRKKLRVQGALVPAANPIGQVVSIGSVFRPSRIFYKPEGGVLRLDVIKSTYLQVESIENGVAICQVISALGNPLTDKVIGKAKMVGVGLKPASIPTRLRFTFFNENALNQPGVKVEERPASGYNVIARPAPNGSPREVGTTDREGRLVLDPGFAEGLVVLRLLAAGTEPLSEFPIMPGEMYEEKLLKGIDPRSKTVTCESEVFALRDEIIDMIAVRQRLLSRMKSRFAAENWDDLKLLIQEYKTLPSRDEIELRLTKLDEGLKAEAAKTPRLKVRTKTALSLLTDTHGLIDRYLGDTEFQELDDVYQRHVAEVAQTKAVGKSLPKMPTIGATGKAQGPPGTASGPTDFSPPGAGFSVVMPGNPQESTTKTADGSSEIKTYKVAVPGKGVFTASYWDYPVAIAAGDVDRVLNIERDRLVATIPGAKINRDGAATVGGLPGKEVEFEGPPGRTGDVPTSIARITLVNSRVFSIAVGGTKALVTAAPAAEFLNSFQSTVRGGQKPAQAASAAPAEPPAKAATEKTKKAAAPSPAARPKNPAGGGATPF